MKTKKSSFDICHEMFEYQSILCNLILTQFNKEIKYDYAIPPVCDVLKIASDSLDQWKTKSQLKKDISGIVQDEPDDAILRRHLWNEVAFGHEWFYGLGDFFRYRKEEKAKAISGTYSHPKLSYVTSEYDKVRHVALKKEVEEFVDILNKNIEKFYKKWEKDHTQ
jgi:hypothetical protein